MKKVSFDNQDLQSQSFDTQEVIEAKNRCYDRRQSHMESHQLTESQNDRIDCLPLNQFIKQGVM